MVTAMPYYIIPGGHFARHNLPGMDLELNIDTSQLTMLAKDLEEFESDLHEKIQLLAGQTHLHIIEKTQERLHSRREMYVKALHQPTEVQPGVFMITLDEDAVWIEEGMPPHSMVKDLLGDNPEVAEDGSRYRVIRFDHSKGGQTQTTPAEQELVQGIKAELKKMRIPWKTPERNADGSPMSGVLHRFKDFPTPARPAHATPGLSQSMAAGVTKGTGVDAQRLTNQHGYGHGPIGAPMQGPTGIPFLKGLTIQQNPLFNQDGSPKLDSKGKQMATRTFSTFRVVSSKHEGTRWKYPGIEGAKFFDEALQWAEKQWEQEVLPQLLKKLGAE